MILVKASCCLLLSLLLQSIIRIKSNSVYPRNIHNYPHRTWEPGSYYYHQDIPETQWALLNPREDTVVSITSENPVKVGENKQKGPEEDEKVKEVILSPFEEFWKDISRPEFYIPIFNDLTFIGLVILLSPAIFISLLVPLSSYIIGCLLIPFVRLNYFYNYVLTTAAA